MGIDAVSSIPGSVVAVEVFCGSNAALKASGEKLESNARCLENK